MGMVVRSNLMAMNANRQLGMNNSSVSKSLEKLSSGFKINRAGDDASGLAISEKMKAQIKGLEQASSNSQDGISLVQTAEGALTEVHDMLNRMTELATKSANGTIQDEVDRDAIQSEVDALLSEIDRIGDSTNFNGISLLDGSLSSQGGTKAVSTMKFDNLITSEQAAVKGVYTDSAGISTVPGVGGVENDGDKLNYSVTYQEGSATKTVSVSLEQKTLEDGSIVYVGNSGEEYSATDAVGMTAALMSEMKKTALGDKFTISGGDDDGMGAANPLVFTAKTAGSAGAKVISTAESLYTKADGATTATTLTSTETTVASDAYKQVDLATNPPVVYDPTNPTTNGAKQSVFTVNGKQFALAKAGTDIGKLGKDVTVVFYTEGALGASPVDYGADLASAISKQTGLDVTFDGTDKLNFKAGAGSNATGGLTLQIGDTGDDFNMVTVNVDDMRSKSLGVAGLDVSTADAARSSIATIKDAINMVSTNRANLGALQNRLEHTINNLDVAAENMTAANSRIRDTDMAKQMMDYTKMNVLTQSAQAMLAQANQQPQSILQLLQ